MSRPWRPEYEEVLRRHLPFKPTDAPLVPTDGLFDLGLDSFGTIELLVALESTFGVCLPDDTLTGETFYTAGSLWRVLSELLADAAPGPSIAAPAP